MKYKLFGKSGLRVSEICLGVMTFGEEWGTGANKEESRKVFDEFVEAGGNFFDTANRYTEGTSEKWLGEFIKNDRDAFVVASKYSLFDRQDDINASGNHRKNMMRSVEQSLKRLNTDYLDMLWLHIWDSTTPVEEVMRAMDDLVSSGKVHYIGFSDTPAWIVSKANTLAEWRGWSPLIALQIEYSLIERTPERDLIPMAHHFGMAITPWSPLGAGLLTGKYNDGFPKEGRLSENSRKYTQQNLEIARKVTEIAKKIGVTPAQLSIRWVLDQHPQMIPIIGARKAYQLRDSLQALAIEIPEEMQEVLNEVSKVDGGFPHDFIKNDHVKVVTYGGNYDKIIHRKYQI